MTGTLAPLNPFKGHVNVMSGLVCDKARANGDGPGDHARAMAAFLAPQLVATAVPARPENSSVSAGTWEDLRQHTIAFFANHVGRGASADGSSLAIVPDEEGATATLRATDEYGEELACVPVPPTFRLNMASAEAWVVSGFEKPRR